MSDTEVVTTRLADRHGVHYEARTQRGRTDRPASLGGQDQGLMASEHLLVALASCTTTTAWKIAEKRGVALADVRCRAEMDFDDKGLASAIRLRIEVESPAEEKDVAKLFDLAERVCTISRLLATPPARTLVHRRT